ncbi:GNAT family N-acetyltransferase [Aeromicrobium sp.]
MVYDHPDVVRLTVEVQAEYAIRYGGEGDTAPIENDEFVPPNGHFVVACLGENPVGMGGWRRHGAEAEVKRMFVRGVYRGRGIARAILTELETSAAEAGITRLILETGMVQPEAIALYRSSGYTDVPAFGFYAEAELSVHLGKQLSLGRGHTKEMT